MKSVHAAAALALGLFGTAQAAVVTSMVGDEDLLGGRVVLGEVLAGAFDNRSAAEKSASDGSGVTDRSSGTSGSVIFAADFEHDYLLDGAIMSARVRVGVAGVQTNDGNETTAGPAEDALLIDGTLVPAFFGEVDQGSRGYGVVEAVLPASFFPLLADGMAVVRIALNSSQGVGNAAGEPAYIDFSELIITTTDLQAVPLPGALVLFPLGLAGLVASRRASLRDQRFGDNQCLPGLLDIMDTDIGPTSSLRAQGRRKTAS